MRICKEMKIKMDRIKEKFERQQEFTNTELQIIRESCCNDCIDKCEMVKIEDYE